MSNLEKIQKAMRLLQILTMIVTVCAFVGLALTLTAGCVVLLSDRLPLAELLQKLLVRADDLTNRQLGIFLLSQGVPLLFGAVLSLFVYQYFKLELSEGTPFTQAGAKKITQLGILFLAAEILTAGFASFMEEHLPFYLGRIDSAGGIALGVCLLLLAVVVRYGAELEEKTRTDKTENSPR